MMGRISDESKRKKYLFLGLFGSLGFLFGFKYLDFFNESLRDIFDNFNIFYNVPVFNILLPIGVSFYTFKALSYTLDVYHGNLEPEKHLGIFALYISFFPQILAGPIERAGNLIPQFFEKHDFDYQQVTDGLKIMLWGFFKKIVIADRLALYVNEVYNNPVDHSGFSIWIATYFYAFQIYCDFSSYSDIAMGTAKIMGYKTMLNFDRPYFSKSVIEFWRRWHISLSTWLRDYLFMSLNLQFRYIKNLGSVIAVIITFLICGLWHGAYWTFLIWGGLHVIYIIISVGTKNFRKKFVNFNNLNRYPSLYKFIQVAVTFHLVFFAWIFFRANSVSDAFLLINNMFCFDFHFDELKLSMGWYEILIAVTSIIFMEIIHLFERKGNWTILISHKPVWLRWSFYYLLLFAILMFGQFKQTEFIYFQF
jgi:D-alanyl-lipoteichoic acid acyltransferase DltB (MBOAT superfamily)